MATKCTACGKFLSSLGAAACKLCPSLYHRACVGLADSGTISKDWNCPECKKKQRKGDNSSTPVRSVTGLAASDSVTPRELAAGPPSIKTTDAAISGVIDLRRELAECLEEMREFRREMADFRSSIAGISARMDGLERRIEVVEQRAATTSPASGVIAEMERTVTQLKLELNDRDQDLLQSDLEIGHLPEEKGENILHTVTVLAAKLGVTLEERDVVFVERVGVAQGAAAGGAVPRERRVVVRLARRCLRDQFLQAARVAGR